jgi:hypothetical protein
MISLIILIIIISALIIYWSFIAIKDLILVYRIKNLTLDDMEFVTFLWVLAIGFAILVILVINSLNYLNELSIQ